MMKRKSKKGKKVKAKVAGLLAGLCLPVSARGCGANYHWSLGDWLDDWGVLVIQDVPFIVDVLAISHCT